jgi:hypothetical protein
MKMHQGAGVLRGPNTCSLQSGHKRGPNLWTLWKTQVSRMWKLWITIVASLLSARCSPIICLPATLGEIGRSGLKYTVCR